MTITLNDVNCDTPVNTNVAVTNPSDSSAEYLVSLNPTQATKIKVILQVNNDTYIHTYIHTDRQTDRSHYIYQCYNCTAKQIKSLKCLAQIFYFVFHANTYPWILVLKRLAIFTI